MVVTKDTARYGLHEVSVCCALHSTVRIVVLLASSKILRL
jgi:hypothetical protein